MRAELAALELRRMSWRRVKAGFRLVARDFAKHDLLTYSSAISFQVLYVTLPLALLALAALGVVQWQSLYVEHIAPALKSSLSRDAYDIANRTALKIMNGRRFWWTTFGLAVVLWGAGAALRSMMTPLNAIYGAEEQRSWLRRIGLSIAGGALAIVLVTAAVLIALLGPLLNLSGVVAWGFWLLRWATTLGLLFLAVATLLWIVPAKRRPVQWISLGSVVSTVCWIVASVGFAAYISAVSYTSFYGAIASAVLLLIYLRVSTIAFLLGVVVDSLLRDAVRSPRARSRSSSRTRARSRQRRTAA